MKKTFFLFVLIALISFEKGPALFSAKNIEKSFGKISDNLYINKYEVSNTDYKDFLNALSLQNNTEKYNAARPDTLVWRTAHFYNEPLTNFYFEHPSYAQYPVVGVSYENALAYCKWLTEAYNSKEKRKYAKVIFRLPTKAEWELAATGGNTTKQYPWGTGFIQNSRSMALCNYRSDVELRLDPATHKYEVVPDNLEHLRTMITSPVKSFYPATFGIYNMSGNVAEMIAEEGVAKGGSYADPAWAVTIKSEKNYSGPTADIGFRVAMEILTP